MFNNIDFGGRGVKKDCQAEKIDFLQIRNILAFIPGCSLPKEEQLLATIGEHTEVPTSLSCRDGSHVLWSCHIRSPRRPRCGRSPTITHKQQQHR